MNIVMVVVVVVVVGMVKRDIEVENDLKIRFAQSNLASLDMAPFLDNYLVENFHLILIIIKDIVKFAREKKTIESCRW